MKLGNLRRLIACGEDLTIEFKRSTGEIREAMEALCAMLNAVGKGRVVFGVSDKGHITGQQTAEGTNRDIANISRRIEPPADLKITAVRAARGLSVLVVDAAARTPGPFTFDNRAYLRVGNTTQRMSHSEFDRRVVQRLERQTPWDRWIAPGWKLGQLDRNEIHRTVEDAVQAKRLTGVLGEKPEVVLHRLELVTDRGVTRAAAILGAPQSSGNWANR